MKDFIFNLQRFDATVTDGQVTIPAGETFTLDNVNYTAGDVETILKATTTENNGTFTATAVTGITSGSVIADTSGSNAKISFDATAGEFDFSCARALDSISVSYGGTSISYTDGSVNYDKSGMKFPAGSVGFTGVIARFIPFNVAVNVAETSTLTPSGTKVNLSAPQKVSAALTFPQEIAAILESFKGVLAAVLQMDDATFGKLYSIVNKLVTGTTTLDFTGNVFFDRDTKTLTLAQNANVNLNILDYQFDMTAVGGDLNNIGLMYQIGDDPQAGLKFSANTGGGVLKLSMSKGGKKLFDGTLDVTAGEVAYDLVGSKITVAAGTNLVANYGDDSSSVTINTPEAMTIPVTSDGIGNATSNVNNTVKLFAANDAGNSDEVSSNGSGNVNFNVDNGAFKITVTNGDKSFDSDVTVDGVIDLDSETQTITLKDGTTMNITFGNYTIAMTPTDDASFTMNVQSDGSFAITPVEGGGELNIVINRGGQTIFQNTVGVTGGTIILNPTTQAITLTDGTEISLSFGDYELTAKANGDSASVVSITGNEIAITPNTGDGTLDLTFKNANVSLNANLEVIRGSFVLGDGGKITVTKDTELKFDFGDGYIVNFKATDDAGGSISLGSDGITFTPGSDDGGLQLSITRDGETRTASLDVTGGSVTYKLDGSISLTQGTVVKNIFADGNILTITANTDASGKIYFTPEGGLTITPETSDAITLEFDSPDGYAKFILDEITGSVTYSGGTLTLSDGASFSGVVSYNHGGHTLNGFSIGSAGGNSEIVFGNSMTFTPASGATITMLNSATGHGWSVSNGTLALTSIDGELFYTLTPDAKVTAAIPGVKYLLEKAGSYTINGLNVTTTEDNVKVLLTNYDTISFANDAPIKISSDDKAFVISENDGNIQVSTNTSSLNVGGDLEVTGGTISFDNATKTVSATAGTSISITQGDEVITFNTPEEFSSNFKIEEGILYFGLTGDVAVRISVTSGNTAVFAGNLKTGGVLSYNPAAGTLGLTGANSSHGDGTNTFVDITTENGYTLRMTTHDTTVVFIPKITDGKIEVNFPNERKHELLFTLGKDGNTIFENQLTIGGTVGFDIATQELSLTKGTVLTIVGDGENALEITALDDASGQLQFTGDGIKFAPNAGDGQLELNFVATNRKANIDVSAGAIILKNDGTLALEKDTVVNLTWEDGTTLKLTASDTGGSIGFDAQGLKISSDGELSIDLTAGDLQTTLSNLEGTIHYNAGKVLFDENATLTATSTLGGQPVNITLDSKGTGGYLEVSATGTHYVAGTGPMSITWSRDGKSSTFSVNNGSIYIGHGIFQIAQGTDLETDLKDLVPALYFTTTDAGEYTVNGQTFTTTTENLRMTATDDEMTFNPGTSVVTCNDMTFTGNGNVSLTKAAVKLGDGITATGFGVDKTFVLYEKGSVTADEKIFELTEDVSTGISVTGADDGFTFSRTITAESEERLGIKNSTDIGKIFTETFSAKNDSSYRIQTDMLGLQQIIGITSPVTLNASAAIDDTPERTVFDLVTETDGTFTVGEKPYVVGGSSSVALKVGFETNKSYVRGFDNLNGGTVSGDFTSQAVSINGGSVPIKIYGDTDVSISADSNGVEIYDLSDGVTLADTGGASKAHTDTEGAFVFGEGEGDSIGVTVQGDDNITFVFNTDSQIITNIDDLEGDLIFSETSHMCTINGIGGVFSGEFSSIGAYSDRLYLHDVADGSELVTGDADKIWLQQLDGLKLNDNTLTLDGDDDGIWLRDKEVVGLDEGASLTVSEAGNYTVNGQSLTAKAGDTFIGLDDGTDAYIYNANNPLITKNSSTEQIVAMFPNAGMTSIVDEAATGQVPVSLSGGDLAVVEKTNANVSISAGNFDTVVSKGGNVNVNLRGGKTDIFPLDGRMSLTGNYDPSNGTGFGTTFKDALTALQNGQLAYSNGELKIGSAQIYFGTTGELVNIFDRNGALQKVGFAEHDASINAGNATDNLLLHGGDYTTLISGSGNDTILADAGSSIDAGEGSNFIELASSRDTLKAGAVVNIVKGNNTIANFKNGFDRTSDAVENSSAYWDNVFDGTNISIKADAGTTVLQSVGSGEAFVKFKQSANGYLYNVALAQKNSVIAAPLADANVYRGDTSGVDFTGFNGLLLANLHENSAGRAVDQAIYFYGVNSLTAGDGQNTLSGSTGVETLSGGKGDSSLWTDAGNDVMIGGDGTDEFFFLAGDGRDVVKNFDFDKDAINILTNEATDATVDTDGNVVLQINHGDDALIIENAAGKNFRINNLVMNVDKNPVYNDAANCFVATAPDATLTVSESADIWLDGSHGKFYIGDIKTIDAFDSTGETKLAGNELNNRIIAGNGDSSLWGGNGGNDTLVGGNGRNVFFYAFGNGSDEIVGTNDGDVVNLTNITLEQISSSEITSDGVTLNFVDGGKLLVNGTNEVNFRINGETYAANHDSGSWSKK